jgi:hypothetical protein
LIAIELRCTKKDVENCRKSYICSGPTKGSIHNRGGAVDTLVDAAGIELDMGTLLIILYRSKSRLPSLWGSKGEQEVTQSSNDNSWL